MLIFRSCRRTEAKYILHVYVNYSLGFQGRAIVNDDNAQVLCCLLYFSSVVSLFSVPIENVARVPT